MRQIPGRFLLPAGRSSTSLIAARAPAPRSTGLPPAFGRELLKGRIIGAVWVRLAFSMLCVSTAHDVVHELHEDHADGMDGIVPIEALGHEPLYCAPHRYFVTKRNLALDDGVHHGVNRFIGQANTGAQVIVLHERDPLLLIHREPFFRIWSLEGIVSLHANLTDVFLNETRGWERNTSFELRHQ